LRVFCNVFLPFQLKYFLSDIIFRRSETANDFAEGRAILENEKNKKSFKKSVDIFMEML